MVILMILGVLILVVMFSTQLTDASASLKQFQERIRVREANYQMAHSAVELAMDLLRVDDIDEDSAQDVWALGNQRLSWEGRDLFLEIRDEESRFPLLKLPLGTQSVNQPQPESSPAPGNNTAPSPSPSPSASPNSQGGDDPTAILYAQALQRLLTRQGLPAEQALASLQDWMDLDSQVRSGGAEQGSYPQLLVKDGPLDSVEEVDQLVGWGPPQLPPPLPLDPAGGRLEEYEELLKTGKNRGGPQQSTWSDWLSIHARGKININTAPAEVLGCLDTAMSDSVVSELTSYRSRNVLKSEQDLKKIPGIDSDLAYRLNKLVGYTSQVFRVRVIVTSHSIPLEVEAMLERKSQRDIVVRYWRTR